MRRNWLVVRWSYPLAIDRRKRSTLKKGALLRLPIDTFGRHQLTFVVKGTHARDVVLFLHLGDRTGLIVVAVPIQEFRLGVVNNLAGNLAGSGTNGNRRSFLAHVLNGALDVRFLSRPFFVGFVRFLSLFLRG